jgi:ssDNA-binding Zn-finger/Zn-ribbon topoisomerase 1
MDSIERCPKCGDTEAPLATKYGGLCLWCVEKLLSARVEAAEKVELVCEYCGEDLDWTGEATGPLSVRRCVRCRKEAADETEAEVCGLCEGPDPCKMAKWTGGGVYWPGERRPEGRLVHQECEEEECRRAHAELTQDQRDEVLAGLRRG